MFLTALFTIVKIWKQPKCPSTDESIKEMWCICMYVCMCIYIRVHTHSGILGHKKYSEVCNNLDGLGGYYSK